MLKNRLLMSDSLGMFKKWSAKEASKMTPNEGRKENQLNETFTDKQSQTKLDHLLEQREACAILLIRQNCHVEWRRKLERIAINNKFDETTHDKQFKTMCSAVFLTVF